MKQTFDPADFVRRVGHDLVRAFENARVATTPTLVGDAMEGPVRDQLGQILPRGIGVGSGCVIDVYGGTSRQMDIVLYERDLCPVFRVNDRPETTYYPVESVLAVGEVKSAIGKKELADSFKKIESVKALNRAYAKKDGAYIGRRYGDIGSTSAHGFYRDDTNKGDVLGFVIAERTSIPVTLPDPSKSHASAPKATLLGHYVQNVEELNNDVLCPDLVVFLDGTLLSPQVAGDSARYTPTRSRAVLPHVIHPVHAESPFGELLRLIWGRYREGLTAHLPLESYLYYDAKTDPQLTWSVFANVSSSAGSDLKVGQRVVVTTPTEHIRNDVQHLVRHSV